jgi:hypothetical protein
MRLNALFWELLPPQSYVDLQMPVPGKNGRVRLLEEWGFSM